MPILMRISVFKCEYWCENNCEYYCENKFEPWCANKCEYWCENKCEYQHKQNKKLDKHYYNKNADFDENYNLAIPLYINKKISKCNDSKKPQNETKKEQCK